MGMYNEVFADCPKCNGSCEAHIPQVTMGFGGYRINSPITMEDLSYREKLQLAEYVNETVFYCETCEKKFQVLVEVASGEERQKVVI